MLGTILRALMVGLLLSVFLGGTLTQVTASPVPPHHSCDVTVGLGDHGMPPCEPMSSKPGMPACMAAIGCVAMPMLAPDLPSVTLRRTPVWCAALPDERAGRAIRPDPFPPKIVV
jgi:hypothetical protein